MAAPPPVNWHTAAGMMLGARLTYRVMSVKVPTLRMKRELILQEYSLLVAPDTRVEEADAILLEHRKREVEAHLHLRKAELAEAKALLAWSRSLCSVYEGGDDPRAKAELDAAELQQLEPLMREFTELFQLTPSASGLTLAHLEPVGLVQPVPLEPPPE
jgi:hypothetical protein